MANENDQPGIAPEEYLGLEEVALAPDKPISAAEFSNRMGDAIEAFLENSDEDELKSHADWLEEFEKYSAFA